MCVGTNNFSFSILMEGGWGAFNAVLGVQGFGGLYFLSFYFLLHLGFFGFLVCDVRVDMRPLGLFCSW